MNFPVHIIAVGGLVFDNEGNILVCKSIRKNTWTFLGGQVEIGESLEEALKREILEESGVTVEVTKLVGLYSNVQETLWHDGTTKVPTKITIDFICKYISGTPTTSDETSDVVWMSPSEAKKLFTHPIFSLRLNNFLNYNGNVFYESFSSQPYKHNFSKIY